MDVEKILVLIAIIAGIIKALTSSAKDIHDIAKDRKKKKRRSPTKKKRRK